MKKYFATLCTVTVLSLVFLCCCTVKTDETLFDLDVDLPTAEDGQAIVVIGSYQRGELSYYLVNTDGQTKLIDVLNELKGQSGLDFVCSGGAFGSYVTKVGSVCENPSDGVYVYFFTSVVAEQDQSAYSVCGKVGGVKVVSASCGVDDVTCQSGAVIFITEYRFNG